MNVRPAPIPEARNQDLYWTAIYTQRDPSYFSERFGVRFEPEHIEGLGQFERAGIDLGGTRCMLVRSVDAANRVVLEVPTNVANPRKFVEEAATALGLGNDDTVGLEQSFTRLAWELWREDDNGNQSMMGRFIDQASAERCAQAFERRGHRQRYWVQHAL